MSWGDMSKPRPTTKEYSDGFDRIFGKKPSALETKSESSEQCSDSTPESEPASAVPVGDTSERDRTEDKGDDA